MRPSSRQAGLSTASGQTGHMLRGPRTGTGCSDILIRNPTDPVIHTESAYMPTLFVVAGPNGSGKSTLTRKGGFRGAEVIDPDTLARDMPSGEAAREALRHRRLALEEHRSHLVETTPRRDWYYPSHRGCAAGILQGHPALNITQFTRSGTGPYPEPGRAWWSRCSGSRRSPPVPVIIFQPVGSNCLGRRIIALRQFQPGSTTLGYSHFLGRSIVDFRQRSRLGCLHSCPYNGVARMMMSKQAFKKIHESYTVLLVGRWLASGIVQSINIRV